MTDIILHDHSHDGIDRRGFLKCIAWPGTGVLWTLYGGIAKSYGLDKAINGQVTPAREHRASCNTSVGCA